jgi:hypothetical protein
MAEMMAAQAAVLKVSVQIMLAVQPQQAKVMQVVLAAAVMQVVMPVLVVVAQVLEQERIL